MNFGTSAFTSDSVQDCNNETTGCKIKRHEATCLPRVAPLRWGDEEELRHVIDLNRSGFDFVIASDVGYDPANHENLLRTMRALMRGRQEKSAGDVQECVDLAAVRPTTDKRAILALAHREDEFEPFFGSCGRIR